MDAELERLGLKENTIVIFTSDNGSRAGGEGGSNAPFRGGKFTTWEGGFRLPFIVRWPQDGGVPAGSVCHQSITSMDLLPTLATMVGTEPRPRGPIDGIDCSGLLKGDSTPPRDTFAYFSLGNLAAIRQEQYKLHFCRRTGFKKPFISCHELYDLENDPREERNLADLLPDVVARLEKVADRFRKVLCDAFVNQTGDSVRPCGVSPNPKKLTEHREDNAYVVAEFDLADRG